MPSIVEAREQVVNFCKKELNRTGEQLRLLKISKSPEGWSAKVEITEENSYLKKMGYPPVFDRNIYDIRLDSEMSVVGFWKEGEGDEEEF